MTGAGGWELLLAYREPEAARRNLPVSLVESWDGLTPVTTAAGARPQVAKNGSAFADARNTITHVGNGLYTLALDPDELDTLGVLVVRCQSGTSAEFKLAAQVVNSSVYETARQQWNDHP
jgi:hypothetical protein